MCRWILRSRAVAYGLPFLDTELPKSLRNRLDVNDFATPVKYIDARVEDGDTIVVIEPQGGMTIWPGRVMIF